MLRDELVVDNENSSGVQNEADDSSFTCVLFPWYSREQADGYHKAKKEKGIQQEF